MHLEYPTPGLTTGLQVEQIARVKSEHLPGGAGNQMKAAVPPWGNKS